MIEKNNIKKGGRTKGTPNRITAEMRTQFNNLLQCNFDTIQEDLQKLKPLERINVLINIAKIVLPALQSIEYKDQSINKGFTPLEIILR
jgi:hypothetical protein